MSFRSTAVLVVMASTLLVRSEAARAVTPQEIQAAIDKAKAFVYSQQNADGNWENRPRDAHHGDNPIFPLIWGGHTALATYALLASGDSEDDPRLVRAIKFLETEKIEHIYALGIRGLIWPLLKQTPKVKSCAVADAQMLLSGADAMGRFNYFASTPKMADMVHYPPHNSTTQYGVLGLWGCAQTGVEIPDAFWQANERGWISCQGAEGGWAYHSVVPKPGSADAGAAGFYTTELARPSMTAAGVACLFITQDYLHSDDGVDCRGNVANPSIDMGLKWLADHASLIKTGYEWYGLERIGALSGERTFGNFDWYKAGVQTLLPQQAADGSWTFSYSEMGQLTETCFDLLFLSRGRYPIPISKLEYDVTTSPSQSQPGLWNERPRDIANITRWMGKQLETPFNWQVVHLRAPETDLRDSPILYISGRGKLGFTTDELQTLRRYIQTGGLLVGNADCADENFAAAFRKLGSALFPEYPFRELPANHVLYTGEQFPRRKWRNTPHLLSLSNGVRELMILIPQADSARQWQLQNAVSRPELFQLMSDIFLYATGQLPMNNAGMNDWPAINPSIAPTRKVAVARLAYDGNWNPEPAGWERLRTIMHNSLGIDLDVRHIPLGKGGLLPPNAKTAPLAPPPDDAALRALALKSISVEQLAATSNDATKREALIEFQMRQPLFQGPMSFSIAHLTGDGALNLTEAQRQEIGRFVRGGGTLIVDAAGGSSAFAASARTELSAIFPDAAGWDSTLPADSPVFHADGKPLPAVKYRRFARAVVGTSNVARITGLQISGRIAIFFSPEDLGAGLVGTEADGIVGYTPATATDLMAKLICFGSHVSTN